MTGAKDLQEFLVHCEEQGGLRTDDVIAIAMPLLEALNGVHAEGRVARLRRNEAVRVEEGGPEMQARRQHTRLAQGRV